MAALGESGERDLKSALKVLRGIPVSRDRSSSEAICAIRPSIVSRAVRSLRAAVQSRRVDRLSLIPPAVMRI